MSHASAVAWTPVGAPARSTSGTLPPLGIENGFHTPALPEAAPYAGVGADPGPHWTLRLCARAQSGSARSSAKARAVERGDMRDLRRGSDAGSPGQARYRVAPRRAPDAGGAAP